MLLFLNTELPVQALLPVTNLTRLQQGITGQKNQITCEGYLLIIGADPQLVTSSAVLGGLVVINNDSSVGTGEQEGQTVTTQTNMVLNFDLPQTLNKR